MIIKETKEFKNSKLSEKIFSVSMVIRELIDEDFKTLQDVYELNKDGYNHILVEIKEDKIILSRTFMVEEMFEIQKQKLKDIKIKNLIYQLSDYLVKLSEQM